MLSIFIETMELELQLGNRAILGAFGQQSARQREPESTDQYLLILLQLQLRIQAFHARIVNNAPSDTPINSSLRSFQTELDRFLLEHPDEICATRPDLGRGISRDIVSRINCSVVWHCSVIILNRVFLLCDVIRTHEAGHIQGALPSPNGLVSVHNEPRRSLVEKRNACIGSANSIATIANEFMTRGTSLPVSGRTELSTISLTRNRLP